jgi:Holliday junction resolvase
VVGERVAVVLMGLHRWAARRDAAEAPIVDYLRACGFSARRLSGRGIPDLLLGKDGITRVVEVKTDAGELTEDQASFWGEWRGNGRIVLRTIGQAAWLARNWRSVNTLDVGAKNPA